MEAEWPDEKKYTLIQLYEDNECLYNAQLSDYRNRDKMKILVKYISEQLNKSGRLFSFYNLSVQITVIIFCLCIIKLFVVIINYVEHL